jgi:hypothetical protein
MFMTSDIFFATKEREMNGWKPDDVLFHLAGFFVVLAIVMPFTIRWWYKNHGNYSGLASLGPVGDFIGGSTMAFFNLASVGLLVATLLIQKRELKETQKEYKVTNDTMKKQQFESTFFNMVNLHHNILKEIDLDGRVGRFVIKDLYNSLKKIYFTQVFLSFRDKFIENLVAGDLDELNKLTEMLYFEDKYKSYVNDNGEKIYYRNSGDEITSNIEYERFINALENGRDANWEDLKQIYIKHFATIKNKPENCKEDLLRLLDINLICSENDLQHELLKDFRKQFFQNPLYDLKFKAYEELYRKQEPIIGHYYRNLYRIIKLIQTTTFRHDNETEDEEEKRKYRGILRAQLSSFELLMIFYNVVYSEKGEKFKELLIDSNFFDDHLIDENFIWKNDNEELLKLDPSRNQI